MGQFNNTINKGNLCSWKNVSIYLEYFVNISTLNNLCLKNKDNWPADTDSCKCKRLLTPAYAYVGSTILSLPTSPVITYTFGLASPRTQRIFFKTVTVLKWKPVPFIFPLKHQVHGHKWPCITLYMGLLL